MAKFQGTSKNWCFTLNNYTEEEVSSVPTWLDKGVRYVAYSKETGEEGTPHLQGFLCTTDNCRMSALKKLNIRAHWERMGGSIEQSVTYCSKAGSLIEFGSKPLDRKQQALDQKVRYAMAIAKAESGKLDELKLDDPMLYTLHHSTYERIATKYMPRPEPLTGTCGYWIYGPPGTGKSRFAREQNPDFYDKLPNQWWDGYHGQKAVLIDDFGKFKPHLGDFFKRWADRYPFTAEIKGGTVNIRPEHFIVTSNYSIEEIWEDEVTREALNRRFKVLYVPDKEFLKDQFE